jgi:carboxymethylenebutenolidase
MDEIQTQTVTIELSDGTEMSAYTACPNDREAHPALLLFQEAFGVNAHIKDVVRRFAQEGYMVIAPELFHRTAPGLEASYTDFPSVMQHVQALTEDGLKADVMAAFNWLNAHPSVMKNQIASIGYCLGGRVSILANITVPLKASVSYYGGGIASSLSDKLQDICSPLLMFWGGQDQHIGKDQIDTITNALSDNRKNYTNVVFSRADHGFFCDARASYHPVAAKLAWVLTLEFLRIHLNEA